MREDIARLLELIKIDSVMGAPCENAPFGTGPRKALDFFLSMSREFGFRTADIDGYAGESEYGEGTETVGVLAHLDVVPIGVDWTKAQGVVEDGRIYGRGAIDDKGPLMACMYALKRIKDEGIPLSRKIRIIAGCSEETGSACMKYYVKHRPPVDVAFTPDSDFPIIICEKGILHLNIFIPRPASFKDILTLRGGERPNVVCPLAHFSVADTDANISKLEALKKAGHKFAVKKEDGTLVLTFVGKPAHAAEVWKGDNAIWKLMAALEAFNGGVGACKTTSAIINHLANSAADYNLGIACNDDRSGFTTMNIGQIDLREDMIEIVLDVRMPIPLNKDIVISRIESVMPFGTTTAIHHHEPYLYADRDSELVRTLKAVYTQMTGEPAEEIITGGGTYARQIKNCVAFGAMFKGIDYHMHNADEFIPIEHFDFLKEIYYRALIELAR